MDDDYSAARVSYHAGQYDQALREFEWVVRHYPDNGLADNALFWKADTYFKMGQYQNALDTYA